MVPEDDKKRVVIIGLGDLGRRIALGLVNRSDVGEIVLLSRNKGAASFSSMISGCGDVAARFECIDVLNKDALAEVLQRERPSMIVQCASLLSPWTVFEREDRVSGVLKRAGFILQISAQLPLLISTMQSIQLSACRCPIVNCSYPDVTHPVLARLNLAPTIGVGNAGMILGLAKATFRDGQDAKDLRLIAHHSHVSSVVQAKFAPDALKGLRLFRGTSEVPSEEWIGNRHPIPLDRELNAMTSAHAVEIILALLAENSSIRTAAPGPFGLPGGWPITITGRKIALDMPEGVTEEHALACNEQAASIDGLERIGSDGTIFMTERVAEIVAPLSSELAQPLTPDSSMERFSILARLLKTG